MITAISRRDALRTSSALLVSPLLGGTARASMLSQTSSPKKKTHPLALPSYKYSSDLGFYCQDHTALTLARLNSGTATGDHLMESSKTIRLFASHIDEIGMDPIFRILAKHTNTSTDDHSSSYFVDKTYQARLRYEPGLKRSEVENVFRLAPGATAMAQQLTMQHGISQHYHFVADVLRAAGHAHGPSLVSWSPEHANHRNYSIFARDLHPSLLPPGTYSLSSPAHLLHVQGLPAICKKVLCWALSNPYIAGYVGSLITDFLAPYASQLAAGICASDAIAAGIADILSAGAALIATPLEVEICGAAVAAAAALTAQGASALGGLVSGVIDKLVHDANC